MKHDRKENENVAFEKMTVYQDGYVYYFSSEHGVPGICRMDDTGEHEELVVACEKIQRIQVVGNQIWFLEYVGPRKTTNQGTIDSYGLKRFNGANKKEEIQYIPEEWKYFIGSGSYHGIADFYCMDEENLIVAAMAEII